MFPSVPPLTFHPVKKAKNNYAFIDTQNLNLEIRKLGWRLDWRRFRRHLAETYGVSKAYLFLGYLPEQQRMYDAFVSYGYEIVFKPVSYDRGGTPKGNVDAELVLQAMIDYHDSRYDQAVVVTSDGDFACLVRYLRQEKKLRAVISAALPRTSIHLKRESRGLHDTLEGLRSKLEYKK